MHILLCGADGFIGRALEQALRAAGHTVRRGVRRAARPDDVAVDFQHDITADRWHPRLAGIDAVINAVGILNPRHDATFEAVHHAAPAALFAACADAGVTRVIQISALGAAPGAATAYLASKGSADAVLASLPVRATVVRPSLVFGPGGTSSRFFLALASLPVVALPGRGQQRVQPVHVTDLAEAVVRLLADPAPPATLDVVGPRPVSYADMLRHYRRGLGLPPAISLPVPMPLIRALAPLGRHLPGAVFSPDTVHMLQQGSTASAAPLTALLGRPPRDIDQFVTTDDPDARRIRQRLETWAIRVVLAAVWLGSALASVALVGPPDGFALAARAGIPAALLAPALYGGAALDAVLGVLTLWRPTQGLWRTQLIVVLGYSAFLSVQWPALWLHPFGPLLKNLPVVLLLLALLNRPGEQGERA
ncbi:SDR family oxidoreductase [Denitromonas iodatirespirans]|uniref:SDR family oxidoreductase n=1 Tax=Denitromonas iodatirespirans TaxID=2795389 RepID=A0A944D8C4_DENI1|nr:SDR family oxidoreductase [Denitromonas iodatirespirans]MBT0960391.1 SDR family oxidoreductase [Denitromonas iodatirespirans]